MNGIVALEDLPEKDIFIKLKRNFQNNIQKETRKFGVSKLSKNLNVSNRIILHWLSGNSYIRLDVLKRIVKFFSVNNFEKNILFMRGKDGSRKGFIYDAKNIFGDIEYQIREKSDNPDVKIVSIPPICGFVVSELGIPSGKKVINNPSIPEFIFSLEKENMSEFVSQLIDDEGTVNICAKHIRIKLAASHKSKKSNIIDDLHQLLLKLDIESNVYRISSYNSIRNGAMNNWQIQINSFEQLEKLSSILNLRHKEKRKKLIKLIKSKKLSMFPRKKCTTIYLSVMRNIETKNGYFTSHDISQYINRKIGHIQNMIHKYHSKGLIRKIEEVKSDGLRFYPAKYKVVK